MATVYEKVGKMVNAVRTVAGDYYKSIVPIFKAEDSENPNPEFKQFGNIITENALIMNQFLQGFQDVILYESFRMHTFDNEFSRRFKKESDPLRRATFETFVNPVNPLQYDGEALDRILKLYPRDVKRVTYVRNREDIFPVSINREEAESAFQSMEAFYDFYQQQYLMLANSNAIVEYNDIKQCFNANYASGALKVINIHGKTPKEIATLLRELITRFTKPSSDFNNYVNLEGAKGPAVVTNTPKESIVFMPDAETLAKLDTDVLAGAYNMEYADVTRNILAVDDWGYNVYDRNNQTILRKETSKIKAVLCDEYTLKFDENLNQEMTGLNGASLTEQRFYHIWQTIALRPFCNCVVLVDDGEEPAPTDEFNLIIPDGDLEFVNNSLTLGYTGTLPKGLTENSVVLLTNLVDQLEDLEIAPLSVTINEKNKTITLNAGIIESINGYLDELSEGNLFGFFNAPEHEDLIPLFTSKIFTNTIKNVPVSYKSEFVSAEFESNNASADINVSLHFKPTGVTPAVNITDEKINITFIEQNSEKPTVISNDYNISSNSVTIPANTLNNETTYKVYFVFNNVTYQVGFTTA